MNDLAPISGTPVSPRSTGFQEFYTARELAELVLRRGIETLPSTERGFQKLAEAAGWNDGSARHVRWRAADKKGRPSREYHVTLLPQVMRDVLSGWDDMDLLARQHQSAVDVEQRKLNALRMAALPSRPRQVVFARAEVMRSIEGYANSHGQKRSWGIARFLEAQAEYHLRLKIEAKRDAGVPLSEDEIRSLGTALILTAANGFDLLPEKLATANDRRSEARISRSSLYDWFKGRDGAEGVLALAPTPPRQDQDIPPAFKAFLKHYAKPTKPSVRVAYDNYVKECAEQDGTQPMTLTLDQVQYILRHKLNNIEKNVGREGLLTLRSRLPFITRTTDDMWPTTVYISDGKTFDAEIADPSTRLPIRPEITSVLDVATRKCVGYALSRKENFVAVSEALRRSCSAYGIPAIFYTDRGAGYKNKTFDADVGGLMGRLGITKMHALPYNSQAKGIIERFNHVWNDLARDQPTYIGRDMDKEAKQTVHKQTRGEIKEYGTSRLLPSWDDFVAAVERTIADYNDRQHTGLPRFEDPKTGRLRHMTPNEAWDAHVAGGFEPLTIDPVEADDLFRPYEFCTVARAQVTLFRNTYFDHALQPYHKQKVMVGYDRHQAEKVWVREFDVETGQPGKLICVAGFMANAQRYVPKPFEQAALENRVRTRLKRVEKKTEAIEAELDAPLLEQQAVEIADFIDFAPARKAEPVTLAVDNTPATEVPSEAPRRRFFRSDEELAAWALQHPTELTPNQLRLLRDCITNSTARKVLEMAGIDTEALRTLLRAAA